MVCDKGCHSNKTMTELEDWGLRGYVSEPARRRRSWKQNKEARKPVYANRRRIRGERGKALLRMRGEKLERSFAHLLGTGGLRRVHVRGHEDIRKRMLIHVAAFNLGLLMRRRFGIGTPRGLQGRPAAAQAVLDSCATGAASSASCRFRRPTAALEPLRRLLGPFQAQLRELRAFESPVNARVQPNSASP